VGGHTILLKKMSKGAERGQPSSGDKGGQRVGLANRKKRKEEHLWTKGGGVPGLRRGSEGGSQKRDGR